VETLNICSKRESQVEALILMKRGLFIGWVIVGGIRMGSREFG
jgi:hypothetical protein